MHSSQPPNLQGNGYHEEADLGKYWAVLRRRWLPSSLMFLLIAVPAALFAINQKPTYQADGKLLFRKKDTGLSLLIDSSRNQRVGELEALNSLNTPVDTEAQVIQTLPLVEQALAQQPLRDAKGDPLRPADVIKQLKAKGIKGTDVVAVSYQHGEAEAASKFVNALMNVYLEHNRQVNQNEASAAKRFILKQLPLTESKLLQAEAALQNFKEQNNVVVLQEESVSAVKKLAGIDEQISQVRTQLSDTVARGQSLQTKLGVDEPSAIALNAVSQSPDVQQVLEEYRKTQAELVTQQTRYKSPHPAITSLERRIAALDRLLSSRLARVLEGNSRLNTQNLQIDTLKAKLIADMVNGAVVRQGLSSQLRTLYNTRANYQNRANILPQLEKQQQDLDRQVDTLKSDYEALTQRLQAVTIAETQNPGNARIASLAVIPDSPRSLRRWLILGGGLTAASLMFLITAFGLDLRDSVIRSVKDLRQELPYPFLGMVPRLRLGGPIWKPGAGAAQLVRSNPLGREVFRLLQTNLKFFTENQSTRSLVITSALAKEGKSTIVANLAQTLGQLGDRVLVIDADLHNPSQHLIWDIRNDLGLSNFLSKNQEKPTVIAASSNVDILPAGISREDPLTLISSLQMEWLINDLSQQYDWVLVDAPPLLVSDALNLSKMVDGIVLVARPGSIDTGSASVVREMLQNSGQRVVGVVANAVPEAQHPSSYLRRTADYYYRQPDRSRLTPR
ncbi:polysaccharide biosynthesis tyrosine autokinase [filamentous cyanobacterium LEGE 11480]|uniref:Polysaccharide biosynthesis tyrosine autokinase n=1 Tax=Romeriopsis navalis LEGE 11480 TaxID=2777977 RepID=A0A928Z1S9_9CYAN|nr:polysaccharide biosynthesis tyrosine autokinase [Romeriopsis navalis]MBE9028804.1 polysaccharide biosynthesis tyrosine autokinase [Romeriopsis navalis LEGE 11480]